MSRVYILCEGATEETFVRTLLWPVLGTAGVHAPPVIIGRPGHKGGHVNRQRTVDHVVRLLKQDKNSRCTTFLDYYGLDSDFPGKPVPPGLSTEAKAERIEQHFYAEVASELPDELRPDRFFPYIQMHEFEGLLFSDPVALAKGLYRGDAADELKAIREQFESPEDINDNSQTAPSKRIATAVGRYNKPVGGSLAALEVGLDSIRQECTRFNAWVTKLLTLG